MLKVYFLDSSAIVKRYIQEEGSVWISEVTASFVENIIIDGLVKSRKMKIGR